MLRDLSIAIARSLPASLRQAIHANASVYTAATRLFGVSVGYITFLMARKASRVFAFEPSPEAQRELERQVAVNGFKNVELVNPPLSGDVRTVKFAITDAAYGSGISDKQDRWPTLELQTSTLDLFSQAHPAPDLIKVDIEGEEAVLFEGASELLQKKRPKTFRINAPVIAGEVQVICLPC